MKKLFSILTTISLSLTATFSTVACANTIKNDKDNKVDEYEKHKEEEEKQKNTIKNGINDLLSDLKYEIKGGSTHYKSEKAELDITISDTDKQPDDGDKKYITINNLTKKIRDEKKYISSWNAVEIITIFSTNKFDLTDNYHIIWNQMEPKISKRSYWKISFLEGVTPAKPMNEKDPLPTDKLVWKIGYLTKESYYVSLIDRAISSYFGGDTEAHEYYPERAFRVKPGTLFDKEWIEQNISTFITKDDENFRKELISRLKEIKIQAYLSETKDEIAKPIEGSWNPDNFDPQYLQFKINFTNRYDITFFIYLQPE